MKISRTRTTKKFYALIVSVTMLFAFSPQVSFADNVATEITESTELNFPGGNFPVGGYFTFNTTPLGSKDFNGHAYLQWEFTVQTPNGQKLSSLQIGMDYDRSYPSLGWALAQNIDGLDTLLTNGNQCRSATAFDLQNSDTENTVACYQYNTYIPGDTYQWTFANQPDMGPAWWEFDLTNTTTNVHTNLGHINLGGIPINYRSMFFHLGYGGTDISCSQVPVADTVISSINTPSGNLTPTSNITPACGNGSVTQNYGPLGGFVLKLGGTDPTARNLESSPPSPLNPLSLDLTSNTGLVASDNYTNTASPVVDVSGIAGHASVQVTAVNANGNSIQCKIDSSVVVSGSSTCDLPNLTDGKWSITATQTSADGFTSQATGPLAINVLTSPLKVSLTQQQGPAKTSIPVVTSSAAGVGYLFNSNEQVKSPVNLSALNPGTFVTFSLGSGNTSISPNVDQLVPGPYQLFFEDVAGNFVVDQSDTYVRQAAVPNQMPTSSTQPVQKNKITCVKGKSSLSVSGANPKCPKGYQKK
jgi:Bacterial Ig-like domain